MSPGSAPRLGLGANARQFWLLVAVNAFVGAMVGLERDVLPLVGERVFAIASQTAVVSFIVSFGLAKAFANLFAGRMADRIGRKPLLVAGWIVALPVPPLLMFAPTWIWIVFANVLLGINQGLCWSMTVVMKIDLVGPKRRGFAMGLNEFAGYLAVGIAAFASGAIATTFGLRPWPFALGIAFSIVGLTLSVLWVRETRCFALAEVPTSQASSLRSESFAALFARVSWRDRTLGAVTQAGLVNNLNDGLVWGIVPLYLATSGFGIGRIAIVAAVYPATWGLLQILTGSLSDRIGRKLPIVCGMLLQSIAIALFTVRGFGTTLVAAVALGAGTALVYPTLLAAIADVTIPSVRATAIGVYRLWRDGGYALGAIVSGLVADSLGSRSAIVVVAALTCSSGIFVAVRMRETHATPIAISLKGAPG